ncbi:hypothetical protein [Mesorhizobium sp.]|uniref:hypothetical protein n=1 Tax=Mesorhizobium sp. TaxID=1871066 RepID=UPI000FE52EBE|nr:hypothetical protein [Mesorhizobium sp.]RWE85101.1 MAG: hypothetical protein EOS49_18395 [Mesorhizobium sp.]
MNELPTTAIHIDIEVHKVIEANRKSFEDSQNDILRRLLLSPSTNGALTAPPQLIGATTVRNERSTGFYGFVLKGNTMSFNNLKAAYKNCLLELAAADGTFLTSLSKEETPARRLVARDRKALYKKTPHLADEFAEELVDGWWLDTNLSQQQVESRLQTACKVANIAFGSDLELKFPSL